MTCLREAWLGAQYGRPRESTILKLFPAHDLWPDFEARDAEGVIERVEWVEADIPGRRRGDEYRGTEEQPSNGWFDAEDDPVEDGIARADQAPEALAAVVAGKIRKNCRGSASLLVYLNISEFGIRQVEIEAAMEGSVTPALLHFQRVWILWEARLYGPWSMESAEPLS